jgi:flavin-dependent dehydrogenase
VVDIRKEKDLWKITTSGNDTYSAKYIVGADGPSSLTARTVFGYAHTLIPGINYEVTLERPVVEDELRMYFGEALAPKGYGWIFPYSARTANIGLLTKAGGKVRDYYHHFLEDTVRPLYGNYRLGKQKSGGMPVNGFPESVVRDNAFLVGDAGAFTDPIFSGGIGLALLTGRLAADSINSDRPHHYQASIDALPFTGKDLSEAQKIFYGFDDRTLNQIGDALHGKSTSYINTAEGRGAFMSKPEIQKHLKDVTEFTGTWQAAKSYLW